MLITLATEHGAAYVRLTDIVAISAPMSIKGHAACRCLSMAGGHRLYALETPENRLALAYVLPDDAPDWAPEAPVVAKKTRKAAKVTP